MSSLISDSSNQAFKKPSGPIKSLKRSFSNMSARSRQSISSIQSLSRASSIYQTVKKYKSNNCNDDDNLTSLEVNYPTCDEFKCEGTESTNISINSSSKISFKIINSSNLTIKKLSHPSLCLSDHQVFIPTSKPPDPPTIPSPILDNWDHYAFPSNNEDSSYKRKTISSKSTDSIIKTFSNLTKLSSKHNEEQKSNDGYSISETSYIYINKIVPKFNKILNNSNKNFKNNLLSFKNLFWNKFHKKSSELKSVMKDINKFDPIKFENSVKSKSVNNQSPSNQFLKTIYKENEMTYLKFQRKNFDQKLFPKDHFLSLNNNDDLTGALLFILNNNSGNDLSNDSNMIYNINAPDIVKYDPSSEDEQTKSVQTSGYKLKIDDLPNEIASLTISNDEFIDVKTIEDNNSA